MRWKVTVALAALSSALSAQGQIGPSVLDLQTSYHVGIYSASMNVPSGGYETLAQHGSFDLTTAGGLTGGLDTWESTPAGTTFTPNDPVAGVYWVAPDGLIEFDFDPQNPGTDVFEMRINFDGSALHNARYELDPEALSVLALAKSSGQSNAALNGTYRFYGQRIELVGTAGIECTSERGTMAFDGAGGVTFSGTETYVTVNGNAQTSPIAGTAGYSVSNDGGLTLAGLPGGMSANGEVLFAITGSSTSSEVGMLIAVRTAASYNHDDVAQLYSYHGQGHDLGVSLVAPRTMTDFGELRLIATTPTTGSFWSNGRTIIGNAAGQSLQFFTAVGSSAFQSGGVVTFNGPPIELQFSDSTDYAVGYDSADDSSLWFAMRACRAARDYGFATAGTGGIEPELGMRTFPTLGNTAWRWAVIDALGGAPMILAIGFGGNSSGIQLTNPGGLFFLDPQLVVASPFFLLGGPAGVAGAGNLDITLPIPIDPSFDGVKLYTQALIIDPAAPSSLAMSRRFDVEFCK